MLGWKQVRRLVHAVCVAGWWTVLLGPLMAGLPVAGSVSAADGEAAGAGFAVVNEAWTERDHPRVRVQLGELLDNRELAPHVRSYAHLRLAQSYRVSGDTAGSRREYKAIAGRDEYPQIHRYEAGEWLREFDRLDQGLPARDPTAPRTHIAPIDSFAAEVFVAADGDDAQDGSRERPFGTLTRARDAIRAMRAEGASGPLGVRILPGTYPIPQTLTLTAEDSGREDKPVVYRAEEPGRAVLYGGRRIGGFEPVSDPEILARLPEQARGKVWQTDLAAQGVHDWGELRVRGGIGQPEPPPTLELYYNGQPMTLARWPNEGFVEIRELLQPGEWYLNRDTGILYFYPPGDPSEALIEIGMLAEPMLALEGVSHVRLEGLVFDLGRHDGLIVTNRVAYNRMYHCRSSTAISSIAVRMPISAPFR